MGEVVIWGEVLFCIDVCMDFCALYFTARLLHLTDNLRQLFLGAVICALAGVICTAVSHTLLQLAVSLTALLVAAALLIPKERRRLRSILGTVMLFVFLESCTGGMMTALFYLLNRCFWGLGVSVSDDSSRLRWFFLAAAVLFFLLGFLCRMLSDADVRRLCQRGGTVTVRFRGREVTSACLFDSGNLVREPISGKPVVIVPETCRGALGIDAKALSDGTIHGSRLIPMKTIDAESLCWGIPPDEMRLCADDIDICDISAYIVFSDRINEAIVPTSVLMHRTGNRKKEKNPENERIERSSVCK